LSFFNLSSGGAIYYQMIDGDARKPVLVFLHEGLGSCRMWKKFPQDLCEVLGCRGLMYDRIGFGQSSPSGRARGLHYLHESALNELSQVLRGLIPNEPYILFGHSDGGSIALIHGAEKPGDLKAIVTVAAHVFVEPETVKGVSEAVEAFDQGKMMGLSRYHGDKTHDVFNAWSDIWLSVSFRSWNLEYLLPSIDCPLLVVQGADDQYASERQVDIIVTESGGDAESKLLDNCAHSPHVECPRELINATTPFLGQLSALS